MIRTCGYAANLSYAYVRTLSVNTQNCMNLKIPSNPPAHLKTDAVGPPDPDSKLRPLKLYIPPNETQNEKQYRLLRDETQKWNQEFWAKHNRAFFKEKEQFVTSKLKKKSSREGSDVNLTAEEMSVFYKRFLDANYNLHKAYNREWYQRNIQMVWSAFKVATGNLFKSKR